MAAARNIVVQSGPTFTVGIDCGKYKTGEKLGYAKNFAREPAFYEEFIIPELDKRLALEYKYNANEAPAEEEAKD